MPAPERLSDPLAVLALELLHPEFGARATEWLVMAGFDGAARLIALEAVEGDDHRTAPAIPMLRRMLRYRDLTGLVIAHNHPSGCALPSAQDRITADRMWAVARMLSVSLIDQFIFTETAAFSLRHQALVALPATIFSPAELALASP